MIWQLVRRDPAWKCAGYATLVAAVVSPLVVQTAQATSRHADRLTVLFLFFGFMSLLSLEGLVRATRFEAGLPIDAHQLFAARMMALSSNLWSPAVAACLSILAFRPQAGALAFTPLQIAAISTCFLLTLQSFSIHELQAPKWLWAVFYGPLWALTWAASWNGFLPAMAVVSALVSVGLLLRAWLLLPASFELAAPAARLFFPDGESAALAEPAIAEPAITEPVSSPIPWWPVLHTVFSLQYWFFLPQFLLAQFGRGGQWVSSLFFLILIWFLTRQRVRWLGSLPLRPAALLAFLLGPLFLLTGVGYLIAVQTGTHRRHYPDARYFLVELGLIFGTNLLTALFCALRDWRRLRFIPANIFRAAMLLTVGVPYALFLWLKDPTWREVQAYKAVQAIVNALPASSPAIVALILLVLAGLYAATAKVFGEAEYTDKMQHGYWDADSWFSRRK